MSHRSLSFCFVICLLVGACGKADVGGDADGGCTGAECENGSAGGGGPEANDACDNACTDGRYTDCSCGAEDPCGWQGDGFCDSGCAAAGFAGGFDDAGDCQVSTFSQSVGTSCEYNDDCAAELSCVGGTCVCCDDPAANGSGWDCNPTTVPSVAGDVCGKIRDPLLADDYGADALDHLGDGCYSGSPNNYWCPPQLDCISQVEIDDYRCGCCAEVNGQFICSLEASFARTHCLGLARDCLDGSCVSCVGEDCGDSCNSTGNGICDEPEGTGLCADGTDFTDCQECPTNSSMTSEGICACDVGFEQNGQDCVPVACDFDTPCPGGLDCTWNYTFDDLRCSTKEGEATVGDLCFDTDNASTFDTCGPMQVCLNTSCDTTSVCRRVCETAADCGGSFACGVGVCQSMPGTSYGYCR